MVPDRLHTGQYAITLTLSQLAKAAHLRVDDTAFTVGELGFLKHRRHVQASDRFKDRLLDDELEVTDQNGEAGVGVEGDEWKDLEIVISRDLVDDAWVKWGVREKGVLDLDCCLL
jgi:histone acetyltransferase MYST1